MYLKRSLLSKYVYLKRSLLEILKGGEGFWLAGMGCVTITTVQDCGYDRNPCHNIQSYTKMNVTVTIVYLVLEN